MKIWWVPTENDESRNHLGELQGSLSKYANNLGGKRWHRDEWTHRWNSRLPQETERKLLIRSENINLQWATYDLSQWATYDLSQQVIVCYVEEYLTNRMIAIYPINKPNKWIFIIKENPISIGIGILPVYKRLKFIALR